MITVEEVLRSTAYRKIDIENLLEPGSDSWVRFDPVLGYVPDDIVMRDGMDSTWSTYRFESTGERKIINGAGRPCRINTYGDSYTFCQQVSDGETWQEVLAAHLCEPIRNFGNGGYGVNQAYQRAMRNGGDRVLGRVHHPGRLRRRSHPQPGRGPLAANAVAPAGPAHHPGHAHARAALGARPLRPR